MRVNFENVIIVDQDAGGAAKRGSSGSRTFTLLN